MGKDPAFLFYPGDFLASIAFMTNEQVGKFIKLWCHQHRVGRLKEDYVFLICTSEDTEVLNKFKVDENGLYYNEMLEEIIIKRKAYSESRRKNRLKKDTKNTSKTYVQHMENENRNENGIINNNGNENLDKEYKSLRNIL